MFRESFMHGVEVDAEPFGFDNELLELLAEKLRLFGFGGRGTAGNDSSRTGVDFEKAGIDEAGDDFNARC